MTTKQMGNAGLWFGTMTMLLGSMAVVQAASSSAKAGDESKKTAQLFRDIRADAVKVQTAAARLDTLSASPASKWLDYDRQWNEIMPSVEDMQMKLARLEKMQAAISPAEQAELDQSKSLIVEIQSRTHQLRMLLDKPGVQTSDPRFKTYSRSLKNEAQKLEKTDSAS
jgi:hypothetical protein